MKSNAMIVIKGFIKMAYTQFIVKVKTIRSDSAFKLGLNKKARGYFVSKGIIHQISCVGTP